MESKFTTSYFGDTSYFFKHQNQAEDLALMPEWEPYVRSYKLKGKCPYEIPGWTAPKKTHNWF